MSGNVGQHRPGPERTPVASEVRSSTPTSVIVWELATGWLFALAASVTIAILGQCVDHAAVHRPAEPWMLVFAAATALVAGLAVAAQLLVAARAKARAEASLRRSYLARVFELGVLRQSQQRTGEVVQAGTESVTKSAEYRAGFLGPILGAMTTPLLVLIVIAVLVDPLCALILAVLLPVVPLVIGGFQRLVARSGTEYRQAGARLAAAFLDAVQGMSTIVLAGADDRIAADLARRGEEHRRRVMRVLFGNQALILVLDAAFWLTMVVGAVALACWRVGDGALGPGSGVALVLMAVLLVGPVDVVGQFFYIGMVGRAAERGLTTVFTDPQATDPTTGPTGARTAGEPASSTTSVSTRERAAGREQAVHDAAPAAISLLGVSAGYGPDRPVFEHFDLEVARGERLVIAGPSGVGKSTIAALLQGHLKPRKGLVLVDGVDASADPVTARSRLAVVEQQSYLFAGTVAENLLLARPTASDEELLAALELARLDLEVMAMPDGLATQVGEHGLALSGGQVQRLAIARAVLRPAPILLLDEPSSQVDLASERLILDAIDELADGRTLVMIAHRPSAMLSADRVVDLTLNGCAR